MKDAEITDIIDRLAATRVPPETIAQAVSMPVSVVLETLKRAKAEPEDEELQTRMRTLAWMASQEAIKIFEKGTEGEKLSLARIILTKTAGMIGQASSNTFEESREAVHRIWEAQRAGVEAQQITIGPEETTADEYAPTTETSLGGADDPRQEAPDDEDPLRPGQELDWGHI